MNQAKCILTINLSKICANYRILSTIVNSYNYHSKSIIGAVVKANCYGLGVESIVQILLQQGCNDFFVASIDEGIDLRRKLHANNSINIFVLNGVFAEDASEFDKYKLIPVLNNLSQIKVWSHHATSKNSTFPAILHLNTGMNRLGITYEEMAIIRRDHNILNGLYILYIMSHLSASQDVSNKYNQKQLELFADYVVYFQGIKASLANSSAIFLGKEYHYDLIRAGAALYGINPTPPQLNPMQQVVSLTAPIIQLQHLTKDMAISYNMTFITSRNTIIATLPIGYADGYPRALSNSGKVYIAGNPASIVGTISMDLTIIDVTDIPVEHIFLGQRVEIIGDYYTIDQLATDAGTISYEILTRLGNRYQKIYKTD